MVVTSSNQNGIAIKIKETGEVKKVEGWNFHQPVKKSSTEDTIKPDN